MHFTALLWLIIRGSPCLRGLALSAASASESGAAQVCQESCKGVNSEVRLPAIPVVKLHFTIS